MLLGYKRHNNIKFEKLNPLFLIKNSPLSINKHIKNFYWGPDPPISKLQNSEYLDDVLYDLDECNRHKQDLFIENDELRVKVHDCNSKLKTHNKEKLDLLEQHKNSLNDCENKIKESNLQQVNLINDHQTELDNCTAQLETTKTQLEASKRTENIYHDRFLDLVNELAKFDHMAIESEKKLEQNIKTTNALNQEMSEIKTKYTKALQEKNHIETKLTELSSKYTQEKQDLNQFIEKGTLEYNKLQQENEQIKKQIDELNLTLKTQEEKMDEGHDVVKNLFNERDDLTKQIEKMESDFNDEINKLKKKANLEIKSLKEEFIKEKSEIIDQSNIEKLRSNEELQKATFKLRVKHKQELQYKLSEYKNILQSKNLELTELETKINTLTESNNKLQNSIKDLKEQLVDAKTNEQFMSETCVHFHDMLSKSDTELTVLRDNFNIQIKIHESELKRLKSKIANLVATQEISGTKLASLTTQNENLTRQLETSKIEIENLKSQATSSRKNIDSSKSDVEKLNKKISDLESKLRQINSQLTECDKNLSNNEKELANLNHELRVKSNLISEKSKTISNINKLNDKCKEELKNTQQQLDKETKNSIMKNETIKKIEKSNQDCEKNLTEFKNKFSESQKVFHDCETNLKKYTKEFGESEANLKKLTNKYNECENTLKDYKSKFNQTEDKFKDCEKKLNDHTNKFNDLTSKYNNCDQNLKNSTNNFNECEANLSKFKKNFDDSETKINKLNQKIIQLEHANLTLNDKITQNNTKINNYDSLSEDHNKLTKKYKDISLQNSININDFNTKINALTSSQNKTIEKLYRDFDQEILTLKQAHELEINKLKQIINDLHDKDDNTEKILKRVTGKFYEDKIKKLERELQQESEKKLTLINENMALKRKYESAYGQIENPIDDEEDY